MLPDEYFDVSSGDINRRLKGSIIDKGGSPVLIVAVSAGPTSSRCTLKYVDNKLTVRKCQVTDETLSVHNIGKKIGYFGNYNGVLCLDRVPIRQYQQGLHPGNCLFTMTRLIAGKRKTFACNQLTRAFFKYGNAHVNRNMETKDCLSAKAQEISQTYDVNESLVAAFAKETFAMMWKNKYPSLKEILRGVKPGLFAVSRKFYIDRRKDEVKLCDVNGDVGTIKKNVVSLDKKKRYLRESIRTTLRVDAA